MKIKEIFKKYPKISGIILTVLSVVSVPLMAFLIVYLMHYIAMSTSKNIKIFWQVHHDAVSYIAFVSLSFMFYINFLFF